MTRKPNGRIEFVGRRSAREDLAVPFDSRGTVVQAQWLADKGRKLIERPVDGSPGYRHALTIQGVNCYRREAREAGGTSDENDAILTSVIRFRFYLEATA